MDVWPLGGKARAILVLDPTLNKKKRVEPAADEMSAPRSEMRLGWTGTGILRRDHTRDDDKLKRFGPTWSVASVGSVDGMPSPG